MCVVTGRCVEKPYLRLLLKGINREKRKKSVDRGVFFLYVSHVECTPFSTKFSSDHPFVFPAFFFFPSFLSVLPITLRSPSD